MRAVDLRVRVLVFSVLFSTGMWLSKVAQPLYFDANGAITAFGIGYAVMAIAGGLSFVWGVIADRVGGLTVVTVGCVIYAVGLLGRVNTDAVPTAMFGAIAGAGASMVLVGMRPWLSGVAAEDQIPRIVAGRNLGNQVGTVLGTLIAAGVFALPAVSPTGPFVAIVIAPCFVLIAGAWLVRGQQRSAPEHTKADEDEHGRAPVWLCVKLVAIGLVSGFYVSLIVPYMPLIIRDAGASAPFASLIVGAMSAAQIAASAVLTKRASSTKPIRLFVLAELATGVLTVGAALALQLPTALLAFLLICRAAFVAIAVAAEETIQFAVIPHRSAGLVFGAAQTAFLIGDAAGGLVGAQLWSAAGARALLLVAGAITVFNAALVPLLLRSEGARPHTREL